MRALAVLGDSITTDHISPAGNIAKDSPAGHYLISLGVKPGDFNSYGARRGNHEVMVRGTLANIRLRNQMAPGTEGGWTTHVPSKEQMFIYDASVKYQKDGVPLLIIAGKEYGSGSSRDWAAKGVLLLGVKAVIAESFERIHRSNLVGMGVLPLEFLDGQTRESLGLTGFETFSIEGVPAAVDSCGKSRVQGDGRRQNVRGDRAGRHAGGGGVLSQRRDSAVRAEAARGTAKCFISVTRLRVRSIWFLPGFIFYAMRSARQARNAPGNLGVELLRDAQQYFLDADGLAGRSRDARVHDGDAASPRDGQAGGMVRRGFGRALDSGDRRSPRLAGGASQDDADGRPSRVRHPSAEHDKLQIPRLCAMSGAGLQTCGGLQSAKALSGLKPRAGLEPDLHLRRTGGDFPQASPRASCPAPGATAETRRAVPSFAPAHDRNYRRSARTPGSRRGSGRETRSSRCGPRAPPTGRRRSAGAARYRRRPRRSTAPRDAPSIRAALPARAAWTRRDPPASASAGARAGWLAPGERTGSVDAGASGSSISNPHIPGRRRSRASPPWFLQDSQAHFESRGTACSCRRRLRKRIRLGFGTMRRRVVDFHQRPARENAGLDRDGLDQGFGGALFGVHQQVQTHLFDLTLDSRDLGGLRARFETGGASPSTRHSGSRNRVRPAISPFKFTRWGAD